MQLFDLFQNAVVIYLLFMPDWQNALLYFAVLPYNIEVLYIFVILFYSYYINGRLVVTLRKDAIFSIRLKRVSRHI